MIDAAYFPFALAAAVSCGVLYVVAATIVGRRRSKDDMSLGDIIDEQRELADPADRTSAGDARSELLAKRDSRFTAADAFIYNADATPVVVESEPDAKQTAREEAAAAKAEAKQAKATEREEAKAAKAAEREEAKAGKVAAREEAKAAKAEAKQAKATEREEAAAAKVAAREEAAAAKAEAKQAKDAEREEAEAAKAEATQAKQEAKKQAADAKAWAKNAAKKEAADAKAAAADARASARREIDGELSDIVASPATAMSRSEKRRAQREDRRLAKNAAKAVAEVSDAGSADNAEEGQPQDSDAPSWFRRAAARQADQIEAGGYDPTKVEPPSSVRSTPVPSEPDSVQPDTDDDNDERFGLRQLEDAELDDILQSDMPQLIGNGIITAQVVEEEAERLATKPKRGFRWGKKSPDDATEIASGTVQIDLATSAEHVDWKALDLPEPIPPRL